MRVSVEKSLYRLNEDRWGAEELDIEIWYTLQAYEIYTLCIYILLRI